MLRYLIDTNIIIFALKDKAGRSAARLSGTALAEQCICSVVEAELYHGATKYDAPTKRQRILDGFLAPYLSLPFDSACVPHYARTRDDLERRGLPIGGNDLMIAAVALTHGLTLVTNNIDEFLRVRGLKVEDWSI